MNAITETTTPVTKSKTALNASRLNAFSMDPNDIVIIGLDTQDGPEHPLYDARVLLPVSEELVQNILLHGVMQPGLVRKDGTQAQCVLGRQRTRATREANIRRAAMGQPPLMMPVMAPVKADDSSLLAMMISENELRQADTYQVKAEKCRRLQQYGWDVKRIAVAFGCTAQAVRNYLSFWDMSPTVQAEVEAGAISPSAARQLVDLPRAEQDVAVATIKEAVSAQPTKEGKAPKAITQKDVATAQRAKEGKDAVPTRALINKVLDHEDAANLSEDVIRALRWVAGDFPASKIAGLTAILNAIKEG